MENPKILIVEDEILIAIQLIRGLTRTGYTVCGPVASGEEAIESVRNETPDLVLMDIRLLGAMDGIEAARQIKVFSTAKIIFTTGYNDTSLKARALALKPLAYLNKPVEWSEIDAVIRSSRVA